MTSKPVIATNLWATQVQAPRSLPRPVQDIFPGWRKQWTTEHPVKKMPALGSYSIFFS